MASSQKAEAKAIGILQFQKQSGAAFALTSSRFPIRFLLELRLQLFQEFRELTKRKSQSCVSQQLYLQLT